VYRSFANRNSPAKMTIPDRLMRKVVLAQFGQMGNQRHVFSQLQGRYAYRSWEESCGSYGGVIGSPIRAWIAGVSEGSSLFIRRGKL